MDWQNIYNRLIEQAKTTTFNEPTELHHIVPRSMNGTDDADNLVRVSVRLHFILHAILYKIYKDTNPNLIFACPVFFFDGSRKNTLRRARKLPRWIRRAAHLRQQRLIQQRNRQRCQERNQRIEQQRLVSELYS